MFGIVAVTFVAAALVWLLPVLLRPRTAPMTDEAGVAQALALDQQAETARDAALGRLAPERLREAQAEGERRRREEGGAAAPLPARADPARRTAWALALVLPLASAGLYLHLGDPRAVVPGAAVPAGADRHATSPEQIEQRVAALAERLRAKPDDVDGWLMLGRSYTVLGRYRDAATALERANTLAPDNAGLLADWADVLGMAQGRRLQGKPTQLIQRALDADPRHDKALALAGTVAFEGKDYAAAKGYWERLLAVVPPDSPLARSVQGSIAEASALDAPPPAAAPATAAASIGGQVEISPALAARMPAGATLFVFARAVDGPRIPLAIVKMAGATLPMRFTLDDSTAMTPTLRLSGFKDVVVGARLSGSGNATPQPGDLIGQSAPLRPGTQGLRLVIDRVQP
ncbi:MAG TPA: c-type cytochrome biogenesis protein CcmI [Burkholderiaceae bacterium]|nr:c-type cytochrome biogenesis protein CcmI [Burkholderiaceae bacterium]